MQNALTKKWWEEIWPHKTKDEQQQTKMQRAKQGRRSSLTVTEELNQGLNPTANLQQLAGHTADSAPAWREPTALRPPRANKISINQYRQTVHIYIWSSYNTKLATSYIEIGDEWHRGIRGRSACEHVHCRHQKAFWKERAIRVQQREHEIDNNNPTSSLKYFRINNSQLLKCRIGEKGLVRTYAPNINTTYLYITCYIKYKHYRASIFLRRTGHALRFMVKDIAADRDKQRAHSSTRDTHRSAVSNVN